MEMSRRTRIGVLLGGDSAERAVSLGTGEAMLAALLERGWEAQPIYVDHDLDLGVRQARIDVAVVALHGRGADGAAQGLLESLAIPYTGPSLATAALTADKLKSKELLRLHNLPTPTYYCHRRGEGTVAQQHGAFGYPCVVKPRSGGSGIGVARARDKEELAAAVEVALRFDDDVIVERAVRGCEVQVALFDGVVLGAAEVVPGSGILDYGTRFTPGRLQTIIPPRLGAERLAGVFTQAQRAYQLFGCDGLARVDAIISESGNEYLLEVESLPDLGPHAIIPRIAHAAGLDFGALVELVVDGARLHRTRRSGARTPARAGAANERRVGH